MSGPCAHPAFARLRIVLVGTTHPGNIGAAARAMKTMCLDRLALVAPRRFPDPEATARASGAEDVLERAALSADLDAALTGCRLVVGTSARARSLRWAEWDPREAAARLVQATAAGDVALVFGRERTGLTNAELERCHALVRIPSNPDFSSLNLAAAVQLMAWEVLAAAQQQVLWGARYEDPDPPAEAQALRYLFEHLERTLIALGFLDPANPKQLMRRLRRLCARARPSTREVEILRGILAAVDQCLERPKDP